MAHLVINYTYNTADVTPPTDFDIDGGGSQEDSYAVDNAQWRNTLNNLKYTRFQSTMTLTNDKNMYKMNTSSSYVSGNTKKAFSFYDGYQMDIYSRVEDVYYKFTKNDEEEKYLRTPLTQAEFDEKFYSFEAMWAFKFIDNYSDFTYDIATHTYVGNDISINGSIYDVTLKFKNNELIRAEFALDENNKKVIEYKHEVHDVDIPTDFIDSGDIKDIPIENIYFSEKETSMLVGENVQIPLNIEPMDATDKTILWESSNPDIVSVDEEGNLQSHAVGTVTITATTKNGLSATITLRVVNMPDEEHDEPISIALTETHLEMRVNDVFDLDANILPVTASSANVKWSSNNSNIAWVDERGVVTALEEGTTTIIAMTDNGLTAECTITISGVNDDQQEIPVENIVITPDFVDIYVGQSTTLTATVYPENATNKNFQWSADSPAVEISTNPDGSCTIRGMYEGNVNIFAMTENGVGTGCSVTILSVANLIHLDTTYLDMTVGETATINAIVNGNIEANIQWLPSNDFVACIESSTASGCTIRALESGEASITAIHYDNNGFSTEIGTVNIHVNPSMMSFAGKMYNCYDIASADISAENLDSLRPQMVNDFLIYFKTYTEAEIDQKSGFGHMECNYVIDGSIIRFTVTFCMTGGEPNSAMQGSTLEFYINGDELSYSNYVEGYGTVTYLLRLQN